MALLEFRGAIAYREFSGAKLFSQIPPSSVACHGPISESHVASMLHPDVAQIMPEGQRGFTLTLLAWLTWPY